MANSQGNALWLQRLSIAWQLRARGELETALSVLQKSGVDAIVLAEPQLAEKGDPTAVVAVLPGGLAAAERLLSASGWLSSTRNSLYRRSVWLTRNDVDIHLTDFAGGIQESSESGRPWVYGLSSWLRQFTRKPRQPWDATTFMGLEILAWPSVFLPVNDTAQPVEAGLAAIQSVRSPVILDVGTGSGAIALVCAARRPDAQVFGLDISRRATWNARWNARRLGLRNVRFRAGSLLAGLSKDLNGRIDLMMANLPWIPPVVRLHYERLGHGWRGPPWSIQGSGYDGLGEVRQLGHAALAALSPGGFLVLQLGEWQAATLASELNESGYRAAVPSEGVVIAQVGSTLNASSNSACR